MSVQERPRRPRSPWAGARLRETGVGLSVESPSRGLYVWDAVPEEALRLAAELLEARRPGAPTGARALRVGSLRGPRRDPLRG